MKKQPPPDEFTLDERNTVLRWHRQRWPHHFKTGLDRQHFLTMEMAMCLDWHRAEGKTRVDYVAAVRNWIRKSMERRGYEPYRPPSSVPSRRGKKPFEKPTTMASLGDELQPLLKGMTE